MALVGGISEYAFGLANFLEANFMDEDTLELRTTPKPSRLDIVENQPIDLAAKKYLLGSGIRIVNADTMSLGDGTHILFVAWVEPDGYLGTFKEVCFDY